MLFAGCEGGSAVSLLCVSCKASFSSAWDLMVHVQAAHMLNIYELGSPDLPSGMGGMAPASAPGAPSPEMSVQVQGVQVQVQSHHHVAFTHAQVRLSRDVRPLFP